jgi:2-haloacid dehalogenase
MQIETVIFDLGGVLIDWEPRRLFTKIFEDEADMEYFLNNICTPDWNVQQDAGRPLAEATQILVDKFPKYTSQIEAFYGRWEEMLGGAILPTVEILEKLIESETHRVLALTNWSAETFPVALRDYDFLQWFEGILVSGDEKMMKPQPEIYDLMCKRYQIDPATAVFIDDSLKNIRGCEDYGMQGIHFKSGGQLRRDLQVLGIL